MRRAGNNLTLIHPEKCGFCDTRDKPLLKCSRCGFLAYCSKECQTKHWIGIHKIQCSLLSTYDINTVTISLLKRVNVQKITDACLRYFPRLLNKMGHEIAVSFTFIFINMLEDNQERKAIYLIPSFCYLEDLKTNIITYEDDNRGKRDVFRTQYIHYKRIDIPGEKRGLYYILSEIHNLSYTPKCSPNERITDINKIKALSRVEGNIIIHEEDHHLLLTYSQTGPIICRDM